MEFKDLPEDTFEVISSHIQEGSTWKSWIVLGQTHYRVSKKFPDNASKFANHIQTLLKFYPNNPWNWAYLSMNPGIKFSDVLEHPNNPWDWICLSRNPGIKFSDVLEHPNKPWDWAYLSRNPGIKFSDVLDHPEKPWDWEGLPHGS